MRRWIAVLVWMLGLCVGSAAVVAGPITFNSALPLAAGMSLLRGQFIRLHTAADATPAERSLQITVLPMVLAYGASPKLALFTVVSHVDKRLAATVSGSRIQRHGQGMGDTLVFGRYTVMQRNRPGGTLRLAPFAGLKIPTGSHTEQDALGRIPRSLQPGSGSWDALLGLSLTRQNLSGEFDAAARYRFNRAASGFAFGDEARFDASFQHRILPHTLTGGGVPAFVYTVLESNLIWQGRNRAQGLSDANSGGLTWYLTPGLQYVTRRLVLEAALQLPVMQRRHGTALELERIWTASVRWNVFL